MATIIHVSNGLIVTIIAGVLAFAGSVKGIGEDLMYIGLIIGIIVSSLIAWRVCAHCIDSEIIQVYGRILCCEYRLNVEPRTSLLLSLIKGLGKSKKKDELTDLFKAKQVTKAYNEMFLLLETREIVSRGHYYPNIVAFIFCIPAPAVSGYILFPSKETIFGHIIVLWVVCIIVFFLVYRNLPMAKNPK